MNRIVVNFVCGHERNDGTRRVELQLTHNNKMLRSRLRKIVYLTKEDFNSIQHNRVHDKTLFDIKKFMNSEYLRAQRIIYDLEDKFSFDRFRERFTEGMENTVLTVKYGFWKRLISWIKRFIPIDEDWL